MRWIPCDGGFTAGVSDLAGSRVQLVISPRRDPVFTAAEARELALELVAVAERIDPQPPPRKGRAEIVVTRAGRDNVSVRRP